MNLFGEIIVNGRQYFMYVNDVKASATYLLFDTRRFGDPVGKKVLNYPADIFSTQNINDFIIEGVSKKKVSGDVGCYKNNKIITSVLDRIHFAQLYKFRPEQILQDSEEFLNGGLVHFYKAENNELVFESQVENRLWRKINLQTPDMKIELYACGKSFNLKQFKFEKATKDVQRKILVSSMKSITYEMLCDSLDMSWFEEEGKRKKDYRAIKTIREFEEQIITPLAKAAIECGKRGERLDVGLDTETTGLNICDLSFDNPEKDHCVAVPISWEDDKAFVIFTDMEFFDSIPNEYVFKRLAPFLERAPYEDYTREKELPIEYELYSFSDNKNTVSIEKMSAFEENAEVFDNLEDMITSIKTDSIQPSIEDYEVTREKVVFYRSWLRIIGHNTIFDGKVIMDYGCLVWFDEDTLQMAFDLNPKSVSGTNKLKNLTRKIFGHETAELSDILGKNNEDKYRYLTEQLVAEVYGGADADYTRQLFRVLRRMMKNKMYYNYQELDVPLLNKLYTSEYHGMNTQKEKVQELAEKTEEDLSRLKEFMYAYVGKVEYYAKKMDVIETKRSIGLLNDEEYERAKAECFSVQPKNPRYEFELKASSIRHVIYEILGYPILAYTDGKEDGSGKLPKTDKVVMKKLCKSVKKDETETGSWDKGITLNDDILSSAITKAQYDALIQAGHEKAAKEYVLVSKKEFNNCKYPLAIVLQKYAELNKEYTAYYMPILKDNLDGKLYKSYSMARIETRRIANAGQTMKGNLKQYIIPFSDDYYMLDFDLSSIEYRIMASLSGLTSVIEKMKNPENDYHVETASLMFGIPAYQVDKKTRKSAKCVGFGVPYGLSVHSLAENLFGVANEETVFKTRMLLAKWESVNGPVVKYLNKKRDEALTEVELSNELRDFMDAWEYDIEKDLKGKIIRKTIRLDKNGNKVPKKIGMVTNELGFYRPFDLSDLDKSKIGSIRRAAGNYPIQSYAAEMFRRILIRFNEACEKYGIGDKVIWHMLIHDELLASVHKSVNPFLLYKIMHEACMITMEGHTNYYVGVNIGNSWGETKDDRREAPVLFVERMVERYDKGELQEKTWFDNPWEDIAPLRQQFIIDRIGEVIKRIQPNIDKEPVNVPLILEKFTNYTVRSYVLDYFEDNKKTLKLDEKNMSDDEKEYVANWNWLCKFESWIIDYFGEGKETLGLDNKVYEVYRKQDEAAIDMQTIFTTEINTTISDSEDGIEQALNNDDYWSFDENGFAFAYGEEPEFIDLETDEFSAKYELDLSRGGSLSNMIVSNKDVLENIVNTDNKLIISVNNDNEILKCKELLKPFITPKGKLIMFRTPKGLTTWLHANSDVPLKEIDNTLKEMRCVNTNRN